MLVAVENEDRGAVGSVADDGVGHDRHRVRVTRWDSPPIVQSRLHTDVGLGICPQTVQVG